MAPQRATYFPDWRQAALSLRIQAVPEVLVPWIVRHWAGVLLLTFTGICTFASASFILPFQWDNRYSLWIASAESAVPLWTGASGWGEPTYRPLALTSIWVQGRFFGLDAYPYLVTNQFIWILTAVAMYAIVNRLTRSRVAAVIAGLALLLDARAESALVWIDERQTSMAVLLGLCALFMAMSPGAGSRRVRAFAVPLLLLATALSKEHGLAFSAALATYGLIEAGGYAPGSAARRRAIGMVAAAVCAVVATMALRFALAPASVSHGLCQEQTFLTGPVTYFCTGDLDIGPRVAQYVYNVGASFVGIPLPWLFTNTGGLRPTFVWPDLVLGVALAALAVAGVIRAPRQLLPFVALVAADAILNFMVYRTRNHLIGAAGVYTCAAVGLVFVLDRLRTLSAGRYAATALTVALLAMLGIQAVRVARDLEAERQDVLRRDVCTITSDAVVDAPFIERFKVHYAVAQRDDHCTTPAQ